MSKRDLITVADFSPEEIMQIFEWAGAMRKDRTVDSTLLQGKVMAMFSEKASLRTRMTFQIGMQHLGGTSYFIGKDEISIGDREPVEDVARNLERWVDVIVARTMKHATVEGLAKHASVPVINALTDLSHPCQAITDLFTLWFIGLKPSETKLVFVGDGNNVCHSLLLLCGMLGTSMTVTCPPGYEPDPDIVEQAAAFASDSGATLKVTHDPREAVKGADAIYTDVWASMGQEAEREERIKKFTPYQVNADLVAAAGTNPYIMHCLPARRGEELTHDVIESDCSIVFEQAENRMHAQKAILKLVMA